MAMASRSRKLLQLALNQWDAEPVGEQCNSISYGSYDVRKIVENINLVVPPSPMNLTVLQNFNETEPVGEQCNSISYGSYDVQKFVENINLVVPPSSTNLTVLQNFNETEPVGEQCNSISYGSYDVQKIVENINLVVPPSPMNLTVLQNFNETEPVGEQCNSISYGSYDVQKIVENINLVVPPSSTNLTVLQNFNESQASNSNTEIDDDNLLHDSMASGSKYQKPNARKEFSDSSIDDEPTNLLPELQSSSVSSVTLNSSPGGLSSESPSKYTKKGTLRKRKIITTPISERKVIQHHKLVSQHGLKSACNPEKCVRKCSTKISAERRKFLHDEFWKLKTAQERSAFFLHHTSTFEPKQRKSAPQLDADEPFRKNKSVHYSLKDDDGTSQNVCKCFFLSTLGYEKNNDRALRNSLKNCTNSVTPLEDRRGTIVPHNKLDDESIRSHITSFGPQISHYRREHAPLRLYLPSDLTLTDMYKDYVSNEVNVSCSYDKYRSVLKEMNISFSNLGHEECELCEEFKLHDPNHKADTLEENCETCQKWSDHHRKYTMARKKYQEDAERVPEKNELIYCADLQKVIMLPRLETFKKAIFVNRLTTYNESFVPVGSKQKNCYPYAVLWHEAIQGRSKDEIISAFYAFFKEKRDYKTITMWLDNCTAQNKNWAFLSFLIYMVNSDEIMANQIIVKYFEPGHTFMAADSFHHLVENSMKKKKKLYDFSDFVQAVQQAKSKTEVCRMTLQNFFQWTDYSSQHKLSQINPRPYLNSIVEVIVKRGSYNLNYRNSFDGEWCDINFLTSHFVKKKTLPPPQPRQQPAGFGASKKSAILKQLAGIIPANRQEFWRNLDVTGQ